MRTCVIKRRHEEFGVMKEGLKHTPDRNIGNRYYISWNAQQRKQEINVSRRIVGRYTHN